MEALPGRGEPFQIGETGEPIAPDGAMSAVPASFSWTGGISYSIQGQNLYALLGQIETLAGLPETETDELAAIGEYRRYHDGEMVFRQGEVIPGIFIIIRGALRVFRNTRSGRTQVLATLQPGTCVGEVQAFDRNSIPSSAEAVGDTDCWLIPAEPLRELCRRNSVIREVVLKHLAGKIRHLISLVEALSFYSVPERVAQVLLDYHSKHPHNATIRFRESQENLGKVIGCGREALGRSLRLLVDLGYVECAYPTVTILDLPKLQRYAQG